MENNKPPYLLLPPPYILSDDFINKIKSFHDISKIDSSTDLWFKVIIINQSRLMIQNQRLLKFCKSIRGLHRFLAAKYKQPGDLYDELLYLEGLSNIPRALFNEDFFTSLRKKYNYDISPYIVFNNDEYVLLYELKDEE